MKKYFIALLIWLLFGGVALAFDPPVGCTADHWVLTKSDSTQNLRVVFYKWDEEMGQEVYACATILGGMANTGIYGGGDVKSNDKSADNLAVALYVLVGCALAFAFIKGIDVMNA